MRSSERPQILHNFGATNSFKFRTYRHSSRKPFRMRNYKKGGRRGRQRTEASDSKYCTGTHVFWCVSPKHFRPGRKSPQAFQSFSTGQALQAVDSLQDWLQAASLKDQLLRFSPPIPGVPVVKAFTDVGPTSNRHVVLDVVYLFVEGSPLLFPYVLVRRWLSMPVRSNRLGAKARKVSLCL